MSYDSIFVRDRFTSHKQLNNKVNENKKKHKSWQVTETSFRCKNCKEMVFYSDIMGTVHRNHCNYCLWSLHVDTKPGNRLSTCKGRMQPIGLTFKNNGCDKYGTKSSDDLMLIHMCKQCGVFNINRIAADDPYHKLMEVLELSVNLDMELKNKIAAQNIHLLGITDIDDIRTAYYGISY